MRRRIVIDIEAGGPHVIVPEGHYVPPRNQELFEQCAGRFVEITFGVPRREES